MNRYYFSGWFTTRAYGSIDVDGELSEDEINEYVSDNFYDLDWHWGHKGEITDVKFDEVEDIDQ